MTRGGLDDALAALAVVGISPVDYLRADEVEARALMAAVPRAYERLQDLQKALAAEIAHAVGKLIG